MENIKNKSNNKDNKLKKFARKAVLSILGAGAAMGMTDKAMSAEHTADGEFSKGGKDKKEILTNLQTGKTMVEKSVENLETQIEAINSTINALQKQKPLPFREISKQEEKKEKLMKLLEQEKSIKQGVYKAEIDKLNK